jgi:multicomponent Na+:H+ antiporter subunit D
LSGLLLAPLAVPLVGAGAGVLLRGRRPWQRAITSLVLCLALADGVALVVRTGGGATVATQVGGWPTGIAIPFAADRFAALLVVVATTMALASVAFAIARGEDRHQLFHPMVCVLVGGVLGAFLTADLFNLFVMFEVMLVGSYVLLTLRGGRRQVRAGAIYVTTSLLASTAFLLGVGLLYGQVGTVNLGELYGVAREPGPAIGLGVVAVAVAFKASLVPLHAWLPRAYVEAGPAVTALFSALLTKAAVYVLYRLYSIGFAGDPAWQPFLLVIAGVTMLVGVLGAVGGENMRGILAFHMVSQMGYLVLPLGLWSVAGVTAGIVYLVQYIAVKGSLFLAAGAVETLTGTGSLSRLGGMAVTRPWLAVGFGLSALSLAGIPPTSGFVGKAFLVFAAFDAGQYLAGAVAVTVSLLTLLSMVKIWNGVFWGEQTPAVRHERVIAPAIGAPAIAGGGTDGPPVAAPQRSRSEGRWRVFALLAPSVAVGVATLVLGLGAAWMVALAEPAAEALLDPSAYIEAVRNP